MTKTQVYFVCLDLIVFGLFIFLQFFFMRPNLSARAFFSFAGIYLC